MSFNYIHVSVFLMKEVRHETEKYEFSIEVKLERELDSEDTEFESQFSASTSSAVKMNTGVLTEGLGENTEGEGKCKHLACGLYQWQSLGLLFTEAPLHLTWSSWSKWIIDEEMFDVKKKNPTFLPSSRFFHTSYPGLFFFSP